MSDDDLYYDKTLLHIAYPMTHALIHSITYMLNQLSHHSINIPYDTPWHPPYSSRATSLAPPSHHSINTPWYPPLSYYSINTPY